MKKVKFGNVLDLKGENTDRGHMIVHGCNSQGVMGSGIAKEVKDRFPEAFVKYKSFIDVRNAQCDRTILGQIVPVEIVSGFTIVNAITQNQFGKDGRKYVSYEAVSQAFQQVASVASTRGDDVHYPLIGAGLGGGDWAIISDIIDAAFEPYPGITRTLWIYE